MNKILKHEKGLFLFTKRLIIIVFVMMVSTQTHAQNTLLNNTLKTAKALRNQKQFSKAVAILGDFEKKYPGNLWVEQLYAQTLFWMKQYGQAENVYKRALRFHPENNDLKYEYALLLYDMNQFDRARQLLTRYTQSVKNNGTAETMLGQLLYWNHDYKQAYLHLKRAKLLSPNNSQTARLYREVFRLISPGLNIQSSYTEDSQPLKSFGGGTLFNWYMNPFTDIRLNAKTRQYTNNGEINTFTDFLIGNRFYFNKTGTQITLLGGAVYGKTHQSTQWQGALSIHQKVGKHLLTRFSATRHFYDNTLGSLTAPLMINQFNWNLQYNLPGAWNGQLGIRSQFFPDDNYVNAYYIWFLSKPLHFSDFEISLGYAFNYMDSKEDRFETMLSTEKILAINNPNTAIDGIYTPYFTPLNQFSHSVLTNLFYHFTANTQFSAHASIGVYSQTLAPGFFIDNTNQNRREVVKTYTNQRYTPMELGANFQTDLSDKLTFNLNYTYLKTYYYSANQFSLGINFYF